MISFNVHFYRFEHVISFSKWKSRSLFPFSAGSKTLKIKRALNRRARWIIYFKKVSELISWVPEVFLLLCGWMLRCIGPKPRDLEPKDGVTSCEASKKRTNRNRKPRMKSLCHSGYGTQALSFISGLNRTLPQAERS